MVEVDPRLFVTCRLCLDVEGQFQIVPSVQQRIKYCFDINVEPFDRLPQLICKKCENILSVHYEIKKTFIEKQEELKAKLQNNVIHLNPPQEESDSSTVDNKIKTKRKNKSKKGKKRKIIKRLMSSSGDDVDNASSTSTSQFKLDNPAIHKDMQWRKNLCRYFVCRICSQKFMHIEGIKVHINEHKHLEKKYKNIFNISCLVVMEKFDGKKNVTHSNKSVVYSPDCILQNKHNPYYYAVYNPKKTEPIPADVAAKTALKSEDSDSTDSEILLSKRRRMLSRSSTETVVNRNCQPANGLPHVHSKSNNVPTVIDCIDIDDSSDSSESKIPSVRDKDCSKTMESIIINCYNRYAKRIDSVGIRTLHQNKVKDCFLQHKVLSFGKKVLNSKGLKCTGILRFLEYKDLNVIWKEANIFADGRYVQIATRMRGNNNGENILCGKNINHFIPNEDHSKKRHTNKDILSKVKKIKELSNKTMNTINTNATPQIIEEANLNSNDQLPRISSVFSHLDLEISKNSESDSQLLKLLNPNPVLNPKQMPKKANESSTLKINKVFSAAHNEIAYFDRNLADDTRNINSLPIVTSIVSLTPVPESNIENKNASIEESDNSSSNTKPHFPRIKVKPVSELMPEKPPNNINTVQDDSRDTHNALENKVNNDRSVIIWPNQNPIVGQKNCQDSTNFAPQSSNIKDAANEYIILDTLEFPNTRTHSPFAYLQNLLHVHNLTLLNTDAPVPPGAVCLIKLKLICRQPNVDAVTLSLSLFCCKNIFVIKVMTLEQRDVNINKLSATWQWQVLKIYNVQVGSKVLMSASKISEETYINTKNFFALLHSIKMVEDGSLMNTIEEKRKEQKRKKTNARQRAYYQRQKDLKKNEEIIKTVPKSNAERQRKFRQHNAEKSYMDIKRRKLCSNEENVVRCSAVENIETFSNATRKSISQPTTSYL